MWRLAGIVALCLNLATGQTWAQSEENPFVRLTKWNAEESWNKDKLIYTFEPNGTFRSSKWDGGKGQGTWMRESKSFVMVWPRYDGAIYIGTIGDREIRGSAFLSSSKSFGTFVLRLIP